MVAFVSKTKYTTLEYGLGEKCVASVHLNCGKDSGYVVFTRC